MTPKGITKIGEVRITEKEITISGWECYGMTATELRIHALNWASNLTWPVLEESVQAYRLEQAGTP